MVSVGVSARDYSLMESSTVSGVKPICANALSYRSAIGVSNTLRVDVRREPRTHSISLASCPDPSPHIQGRERMELYNESGLRSSRRGDQDADIPSLAVLDFAAEEDKAGTVADRTAPPSLLGAVTKFTELAVVFRELVDHLEVDFTLAIDDDTNSPVVVVLTEQDANALNHGSRIW